MMSEPVSNLRPDPDPVLVAIADYVMNGHIDSEVGVKGHV